MLEVDECVVLAELGLHLCRHQTEQRSHGGGDRCGVTGGDRAQLAGGLGDGSRLGVDVLGRDRDRQWVARAIQHLTAFSRQGHGPHLLNAGAVGEGDGLQALQLHEPPRQQQHNGPEHHQPGTQPHSRAPQRPGTAGSRPRPGLTATGLGARAGCGTS